MRGTIRTWRLFLGGWKANSTWPLCAFLAFLIAAAGDPSVALASAGCDYFNQAEHNKVFAPRRVGGTINNNTDTDRDRDRARPFSGDEVIRAWFQSKETTRRPEPVNINKYYPHLEIMLSIGGKKADLNIRDNYAIYNLRLAHTGVVSSVIVRFINRTNDDFYGMVDCQQR